MSNPGVYPFPAGVSSAGVANASGIPFLSNVIDLTYQIQSGFYTVPADGWLSISVVGAGASGSIAYTTGFCGGAGAPEVAFKDPFFVKAGVQITCILGAGGVPIVRSTSGQTIGNAGNDTTISGPGLFILVKGGNPGAVGPAVPVSGGRGGNGGYGATRHYEGGPGGDYILGSNNLCPGNGATNIRGLPPARVRGGHINGAAVSPGSAAGGGGVGGRGADITVVGNVQTSGGGSGGDATNNLNTAASAGVNFIGQRQQASPTLYLSVINQLGLDYFGGGGYGTTNAGPGGGGPGNTSNPSYRAGIFGGEGGLTNVSTNVTASTGTWNSGQCVFASSGTITSGAGDSAKAIFLLRS